MRSFALVCSLLLALAVQGCGRAPIRKESDPKILLDQVCAIGRKTEPGVKGVKGSIWMKASSRDASGQFPAQVTAQIPDRLDMEVTNLFGGREAVIRVTGKQYSIEVPGKKNENRQGTHSWAGIPLQWATDLFLGRVPCPASGSLQDAALRINEREELVVQTKAAVDQDAQQFVYRFKNVSGRQWPEALHWERLSAAPLKVDFKFEEPEDGTRSPTKWEAKSVEGEVKVRWKERELLR